MRRSTGTGTRSNPVATPGLARTVNPLALAAGCGLLAGWIENLVVFAPRLSTGSLIWTDWHSLWITPFASVLYLLIAGGAVAVAETIARRPSIRLLRIGLVALAGFGVASLFHPQLHWIAGGLLSLGLAVQVDRSIARHPAGAVRTLRFLTAGFGLVTGLVAVAVSSRQEIREWSASRKLPDATPGRPNLLLLILDTVRARNMSVFGASRRTTPHLEQWTRKGVVFSNAFSTSSWTLTSHASMFTGRYPYELAADWTRPLETTKTLAGVLTSKGYRTGGFVSNFVYTSAESGLGQGFARYQERPISLGRLATGAGLGRFVLNNRRVRQALGYYRPWVWRTSEEVSRAFLRWLDRTGSPEGRPFFAFLNLYDAHEPYLPPEPYYSRFGPDEHRERGLVYWKGEAGRPLDELPEPVVSASEERAYDGGIAYMDAVIDNLLRELDRRGILTSTVVVVASDHGEAFGEFGVRTHGNALYPESLHVPLILFGPGIPAETRVAAPVTLRDIGSTMLELAGVGADSSLPGRSLARYWRTPSAETGSTSPLLSELWPAANQPEWFPVVHGYMRSLIAWPFLYVRRGDGHEEFIRLDVSPAVAAEPPDSLRAALRRHLNAVPEGSFHAARAGSSVGGSQQ